MGWVPSSDPDYSKLSHDLTEDLDYLSFLKKW
jgi:hypothetical protein